MSGDDELTRTALTSRHEQLGAKLGPFAGWLMPIEFAGTLSEHAAVRTGVGVFDVSHLGTVWVTGADAVGTVGATFTNDPGRLGDGQAQYTLCCDDGGGIVDDLIVYRVADNSFLAVPNAANTAAVATALRRNADTHGSHVSDESTAWAILAVQGPMALATVDAVLADASAEPVSAADAPYLGVTTFELGGDVGYLGRTGYTGEPGCELVVPNAAAEDVFDRLLDAGAVAVGLGARDTLRLEMGYPLHGNDITRETDPYEARLAWAVALDRAAFTGQDALRALADAGPSRRLWGLRGDGRRPPRRGMTVHAHGDEVGTVTSGSFSPTLGVGIGLAYLADPLGPGDEVIVDVRGADVPFAVVKPPFVDRDPRG